VAVPPCKARCRASCVVTAGVRMRLRPRMPSALVARLMRWAGTARATSPLICSRAAAKLVMKTSCLCECLFAPLSMAGGLQLPLLHLTNPQGVAGYLHDIRLNRLFFAAWQHLQHAFVAVIDDHGDVLAGFFFNASSSIPNCRIGRRGVLACCCCRRT